MHITIHLIEKDFYGPKKISLNPKSSLTLYNIPIQYRDWLKNKSMNERDCIYILVGSDSVSDKLVYVWVSTQVSKRMNSHMSGRDRIEDVLIYKLNENYWESVLKFIESSLLAKIKRNIDWKLDNNNSWSSANIDDINGDLCDEILEEIEIISDASWYDFLKSPIWSSEYKWSNEWLVECTIDKGNQHARWIFDGKHLTVLAWSTAKKTWGKASNKDSINSKNRTAIIVEKLLENGVLIEMDWSYVFQIDHEFSTATQAAHVILRTHCSWPLARWLR